MQILAMGMNHKTAPIDVRERLALTEGTQGAFLDALRTSPAVNEGAVLSTCNRLEVYAVASRYHEAVENLVDLLASHSGLPVAGLMPHLYTYHHHEVARHLFRVACGLDSMILGETQILGQVRDAYQLAVRRGTVGTVLHELFQRALRVGKRAHTETAIGQQAASISFAAVELARQLLGPLAGRTVLVIGAGEMAELAADTLRRQGAARVWFANRTEERARRLADEFGGEVVPLANIDDALAQVDIVIVSTAAAEYVLTARRLGRVVGRRAHRPLLIIDIAVPRNVEPAAAELPGLRLYHIDDLQSVVEENLRQRGLEVPKVEAIIRQEVTAFSHWLNELEIVPLIRSLREKAEQIRQEEVRKLFARLPHLSDQEQAAIATATAVIVKKILNEPTVRLKQYAGGDHGNLYVQALSDLFNLAPPGRSKVV
ncbi:MAG TPA: glutamyl-tRNA reductase [Bacillota bacterium]